MKLKEILIAAMLLLLLSACGDESGTIYGGVRVGDIDVGNMNAEECISAMQALSMPEAAAQMDIDGEKVYISSSDVDAHYLYEETAEDAVAYAKSGNAFTNFFAKIKAATMGEKITMRVGIDADKLSAFLAPYETALTEPVVSYGEASLLLTNGKSGMLIDRAAAEAALCDYFAKGGEVKLKREKSAPEGFDAQKLHDAYAGEFKNAAYAMENGEVVVTEGSNGCEFDVKEAAKIISKHQAEGEEFSIPATLTLPEHSAAELKELLFASRLSSFTTSYTSSDANRSNNIVKASGALNGKILMPGEEFSFNGVVGQRTTERGYMTAHAYANGQVIDEVGGGICQVSSTLYNAALYANLEITSRRNHQLPVGYVKAGLDATVDWGNIDFKFKNNTAFPVKLTSSNASKKLTISVIGTKSDPELTVEVTAKTISTIEGTLKEVSDDTLPLGTRVVEKKAANGCVAEAYRIVYKNGTEQSREFLGKSTYKATEGTVRVGTNAALATEAPPQIIQTPVPQTQTSNNGI